LRFAKPAHPSGDLGVALSTMTHNPPSSLALTKLLLRLRRRARALAILTGVNLVGCFGALLLLILCGVLGAAPGEELFALSWLRLLALALLGISIFVAGFLVYHRSFRPTQSNEGVALLLERRRSESAGLVSAVEFQASSESGDLAKQGYSSSLALGHVAEMERRLLNLDLRDAVDTKPAVRTTQLFLAAAALCTISILASPQRLGVGFARLFGQRDGLLLLKAGQGAEPPKWITFDVALTYNYPGYTRRAPRSIEGTSGDILAPPGTEVKIRTTADRDVQRAELLLGDSALPLTITQGRSLRGSLIVREEGAYSIRFLDADGEPIVTGAAHRIQLEADAWPTIQLKILGHESDEKIIEVERSDELGLEWKVKDDFGLGELTLLYQRRGGSEERQVQRSLDLEAQREAEGTSRFPLSSLSLSPGERLTFRLQILDNDAVSGPKAGYSQTYTLELFSKVTHHQALIDEVEAIWKKMLQHLADELENPFSLSPSATPWNGSDPSETVPSAKREETQTKQLAQALNRSGTALNDLRDLIEELRAMVTKLSQDELAQTALLRAVDNAAAGLSTAERQLEVSLRALRMRLQLPPERLTGLLRLVRSNQAHLVQELEKDILYLEDLLDRERVLTLEEITRELQESKRRLEALVDALRKSPSEALRTKIGEEIARLKERMFELMQKMQQMARTIRDEHLNQEALQELQKNQDLMGQLDDLQKLINEGKLEEALNQLNAMSQQLDKMMQEFQKGEEGLASDKYQALAKQVAEARDELSKLSHEQDGLLKESQRLRERYQKELVRRVRGRLDELATKLAKLAEEARSELDKLPPAVERLAIGLYDREALLRARRGLEALKMLLDAKDFDEALKLGQETLRSVASLQGLFSDPEEMSKQLSLELTLLRDGQARVDSAHAKSKELVEELEKIFPDPREVFDAPDQTKMREMAKRQSRLQERTQRLSSKMKKIGEQAPVLSPGMESNLHQAKKHMGDASSRLELGDARQASAEARSALDRLEEVSKQMEAAEQQRGPGGMPVPMGPGGQSGASGVGRRKEHVEIPDASAYKAPEAFRKELLEAMKDASPKRYKEQVKRYYEELVK